MKLIDIDDYKIRIADDEVNVDEMSEEIRDYYFKLYSLYMDLFIKFLIKKTKIKEYDQKLDSYDLHFVKNDVTDLDFYQNYSRDYLNYYYLRNNLYIYRLNKEENEFLKNKLITKNYDLDKDTINFIINTFRKVIFEKVNGEEITSVNYATNNVMNLSKNDSIVIGIRYDENNNGLEDEVWFNNYLKQKDILLRDMSELSVNIKDSLYCSCSVFEYDDSSIKKKESNYVK